MARWGRHITQTALATLAFLPTAHGATAASAAAEAPRQLDVAARPWKGDFDAMLERRMIRIDTPRSRTLYYVDKGRERGLTVELARDFERWINKTYVKELGKRPLTVAMIPATRDRLLANLDDGLADIAAGNLSVTDDHSRYSEIGQGINPQRGRHVLSRPSHSVSSIPTPATRQKAAR